MDEEVAKKEAAMGVPCKVCGREFKSQKATNAHMRAHPERKNKQAKTMSLEPQLGNQGDSSEHVLIFGSLTEDEIRSLKCKPQNNLEGLTFGSFDAETLRSVGIVDNKVLKPNGAFPGDSGSNKLEPKSHIEKLSSSLDDIMLDMKELSSFLDHIILDMDEIVSSYDDIILDDGIDRVGSDKSIFKPSNGSDLIPQTFLPRGLVNLGNLCFLNAALQALLSCSPFYELLHELRNRYIPEREYPTLRAFVDFISEFDLANDLAICKRNEKNVLETGEPFQPVMFESILKSFTPDIHNNLSGRPRQEDAQEFLCFVMHQMHNELLKLDGQISHKNGKSAASLVSSTDDEGEEDGNWETVGPMNKTAITRTQSFMPSKLSAIFGGQLKSVVTARGNKASATIQPFLLLHLNICPEPVSTIEDALRLFSAPETLEAYRTSSPGGKGEVVTASKSVKILELSEIMVLHLMRFTYGNQGSTKLHKAVHFPLELVIGRELLSYPSSEGRRYELVATITHHGMDPSEGHYTADARHPNGNWLRFDDSSVTHIQESKVLHAQAYILFYKQVHL